MSVSQYRALAQRYGVAADHQMDNFTRGRSSVSDDLGYRIWTALQKVGSEGLSTEVDTSLVAIHE